MAKYQKHFTLENMFPQDSYISNDKLNVISDLAAATSISYMYLAAIYIYKDKRN